jgi:hypothetical protein
MLLCLLKQKLFGVKVAKRPALLNPAIDVLGGYAAPHHAITAISAAWFADCILG